MSYVFDAYARYYDLLYRDKDYARESEYVSAQIRKQVPQAKHILELGCGTGAHAEYLARMGYIVHGVDLSEAMLSRAEMRKGTLPPEVGERLTFGPGDVRTVRTGEKYDAVISLFHVISYQTTNEDLVAAFETVSAHLQPGGLLLFDFWYGPAVLMQKPTVRVKRLEDEEIRVTRIAEPEMHVNVNVVDVNYQVWIEINESGKVEQVRETHKMRYFFLPELSRLLESSKFEMIETKEWLTNNPPGESSWGVMAVARKRNE